MKHLSVAFIRIPSMPLAYVHQVDNYDLLANEQEQQAQEGEENMLTSEDPVNGVNGVVEGDQEMVNAEEQTAPAAPITTELQPNTVRITTPYLTKYERARILGTRALQIRSLLFLSSCHVSKASELGVA